MDIAKQLANLDEATAKGVLQGLLEGCVNPAFGSLPKTEVELLVLNALQRIGAIAETPGIYELVSKLRVTRAKARRLIYDLELRRSSVDDLDRRLKELLKRPLIQKNGDLFVLEVESPLLSDHLRARVQQLGHVTDGSFSPNIVKLGLDAMTALIGSLLTDADKEAVRRALVRAGAPDTSFAGVLKASLKKLATKVAADTGEALMDKVSDYLAPLLDAGIDGIGKLAGELFAEGQRIE
jgi:hypothetical protein